MNKLFKLKKWLSLDGAAKRLSESFGEDVSKIDVIQLALDGHLRLSLRLIRDLYALRWYKKPKDKIEYEEFKYHLGIDIGGHTEQPIITRQTPIGRDVIYLPEFCEEDERLQLGETAIVFARDLPGREIVDLPITRYSRVFLLQCLDMLSRPEDESPYDTGRLLIQEENGDIWQVESYDDFLLDDIEIVVRAKALSDLEQSSDPAYAAREEKPLGTRERETLYKIIIGLAIDGHGYNPNSNRNTVFSEVSKKLDELEIPVSEETIRNHIKKAKELIPLKPA